MSVFAAVGRLSSAAPNPQPATLSSNCFLLHSIICGRSVYHSLFLSCLLRLLLLFCSTNCLSRHLCPGLNVRSDRFLEFLPLPLLSTTRNIFHPFPSLLSPAVYTSLHFFTGTLKIDPCIAPRSHPFCRRADGSRRRECSEYATASRA